MKVDISGSRALKTFHLGTRGVFFDLILPPSDRGVFFFDDISLKS